MPFRGSEDNSFLNPSQGDRHLVSSTKLEKTMLSKHISQSDRLERAILLIRILGYATFLGLITIIFIAAWAQYATLTTLQRVTREDGIFENFSF